MRYMKRIFSIVLLSLCFQALSGLSESAALLDETKVVIASRIPSQQSVHVITKWEFEARCRLELIRRYGKEGVDRKGNKALKESVLKTVIDESVVFMELSRLGFKETDENLIQEKLNELVEQFGEGEEELLFKKLKNFSITRQHVMNWIERAILVEKYIDAQFFMTGSYDASTMDKVDISKLFFRNSIIEEIKKRYRIWVF